MNILNAQTEPIKICSKPVIIYGVEHSFMQNSLEKSAHERESHLVLGKL